MDVYGVKVERGECVFCSCDSGGIRRPRVQGGAVAWALAILSMTCTGVAEIRNDDDDCSCLSIPANHFLRA